MITDRLIQIVLGVLLALSLAFGVAQTLRLNAAKKVAAEIRQVLAAERLQAAQDALAAQESNRIEERRRTARAQEIEREGQADRERVAVGFVRSGVAGDGLRARADAYAARCRGAAGDPAAAERSTPAEDPGAVLADVLGRVVEEARQLALVADERGAAGHTCERAYDALTEGQ